MRPRTDRLTDATCVAGLEELTQSEQEMEKHATRLHRELVTDLGTPKLDNPAESTPVVPAPETARLDRPVEKRKEPAESSQDHVQHGSSETGHQSRRVKLNEVRVVAGLFVLRERQCQTGLWTLKSLAGGVTPRTAR